MRFRLMMRSILLKGLFFMFSPLYKKPGLKSSDLKREGEVIHEEFRRLSVFPIDTPYESQNEWHNNLNELRDKILQNRPQRFLNLNVVSRTMFIAYANYSRLELRHIQARDDWEERWRNALVESSVGEPTPYIFWPLSSSNLIHHSYHLVRFEEKMGVRPDHLNLVLEFGGGYGSMCRLFHELHFKGLYIIFDFVHFSKIQTYFLKAQGYRFLTKSEAIRGENGFICVSDLQDIEDILTSRAGKAANSLFLATWSLSESPLSLRTSLEKYLKIFKYGLIAYQERFNEVLNGDYFKNLYSSEAYETAWEEIKFLKNNWYCFARHKDI